MTPPPRRRRFVAAAVVLTAAAIAVAACTGGDSSTPEPTFTPSPSPEHGHPADPGVDPDTVIPPDDEALDVAEAFLAEYADSDRSAEDWYAAVEPYCYSGYAKGLKHTDPARIPFDEVTGKLKPVEADRDDNRSYSVKTDAGVLTIHLAALAGEWLVFSVEWEAAQ